MSKLPVISGKDCVKALGKIGYYFKRQEGSHIILRRDDPFSQVVVPDHKELDRGTLRAIIRQAGLSVDEFVKLL
ncbi:MAG: type II toxin-antitoxin system HicA family toxin [Candidatus Latescibacteria bacterium]|nr:type II toxin-antitoxin system HicA family toxin [Candidatus Latescibacterota bacterium]